MKKTEINKILELIDNYFSHNIEEERFIKLFLDIRRGLIKSEALDRNTLSKLLDEIFYACEDYQPESLRDEIEGDIGKDEFRRRIKQIQKEIKLTLNKNK